MKNSTQIMSEYNTAVIPPDSINVYLKVLKDEGFRFITMSSVDLGDEISVFYHLDKDLEVRNLNSIVPKGKSMPSASSVYFCAFLVENEIKEQFGVEFSGLPLDYLGMLYLDEEVRRTPFCKMEIYRKQEA